MTVLRPEDRGHSIGAILPSGSSSTSRSSWSCEPVPSVTLLSTSRRCGSTISRLSPNAAPSPARRRPIRSPGSRSTVLARLRFPATRVRASGGDEVDRLEQLGEQYETVVGLGLLTWTGHGATVRRHLLAMSAQVRFEAETGRITVGPPPEGGRLRFEEDMLEAAQLPGRELVRSLGERLADLGAEPWDRGAAPRTGLPPCDLSEVGFAGRKDDV